MEAQNPFVEGLELKKKKLSESDDSFAAKGQDSGSSMSSGEELLERHGSSSSQDNEYDLEPRINIPGAQGIKYKDYIYKQRELYRFVDGLPYPLREQNTMHTLYI